MFKTTYAQVRTGNPFNTQAKMLHHADKISEYQNKGDTTPILIEVNLTNKCQLKCPWCFTDRLRQNEEIDVDKLMRFLLDYVSAGGKAVTWSGGGEPTLHSRFPEIVRGACNMGLEQGLMTNGIYPPAYNSLIENHFSWVRFSVDCSDSETYRKIKGIDALPRVKANIIALDKGKIKVGINKNLEFADPEYVRHIYEMAFFAQDCGVHYFQVRPALPNLGEVVHDVSQVEDQRRFLDGLDGRTFGSAKVVISMDKYNDLVMPDYGRYYTRCASHIFEPAIDANGDLCVCMYQMKKPEFIMGNIYSQTLQEIWKSDQRLQVIKYCHTLDFSQCQICCKGHEINKLVHYLDQIAKTLTLYKESNEYLNVNNE